MKLSIILFFEFIALKFIELLFIFIDQKCYSSAVLEKTFQSLSPLSY